MPLPSGALLAYDTRLWVEGDTALTNIGSIGASYNLPILTDLAYEDAYGTQDNDYYAELDTATSSTGIEWGIFGDTPGVGGVFTFIFATGNTSDGAGYAKIEFNASTEAIAPTVINYDGTLGGPEAVVTFPDPALFVESGLTDTHTSTGAADDQVYFIEVDLTNSPTVNIYEGDTLVEVDTRAAYSGGTIDAIYDPGEGVKFTIVGADTGWPAGAPWRMRGMALVRGELDAAGRDEWIAYYTQALTSTASIVPVPQILYYAEVNGSSDGFFTLDDDTLGELDGVGILVGDFASVVTNIASAVTVTRGRNREIDEFTAGIATLTLRNDDRQWDPTNVSGTYYGQILPGKRMDVVADDVVIFSGVTKDWSYDYIPGSRWSQATVQVVDALGVLAAKQFDEWTTSPQAAGERLQAILARAEVGYTGTYVLDDGVQTLQGDTVSWGSNVLNYAQLVARSDYGRLFASRTNDLTFRDRLHAVNDDPYITFAPDEFGCRYHGIRMELGSTFLYNRVTVDREGGTAQTAEDVAAQTSTGLGVLSLYLSGLLLDSDDDSLALAEYLLGIYLDPELRLTEIVIHLHDGNIGDEYRNALLNLELGELVRVRFAPDLVNTDVDFYGLVEGIRHEMAPQTHTVTVYLSAADRRTFFELDHAIRGELDGIGALAF